GSGGVACKPTGTATRFTVTPSRPRLSSRTGWTTNPGFRKPEPDLLLGRPCPFPPAGSGPRFPAGAFPFALHHSVHQSSTGDRPDGCRLRTWRGAAHGDRRTHLAPPSASPVAPLGASSV